MRVCRASTGGLTGGQGPTRASQVYLILITCQMKIKFGFLIVFYSTSTRPSSRLHVVTLGDLVERVGPASRERSYR
jgi:hypothetical protein